MRAVVQRVAHAEVAVDGKTIGKIGAGLLVFLGAGDGDTAVSYTHLRPFPDRCMRYCVKNSAAMVSS